MVARTPHIMSLFFLTYRSYTRALLVSQKRNLFVTRGGSFEEIEFSRLMYSWLSFGLASTGYIVDSDSTMGRCTYTAG